MSIIIDVFYNTVAYNESKRTAKFNRYNQVLVKRIREKKL